MCVCFACLFVYVYCLCVYLCACVCVCCMYTILCDYLHPVVSFYTVCYCEGLSWNCLFIHINISIQLLGCKTYTIRNSLLDISECLSIVILMSDKSRFYRLNMAILFSQIWYPISISIEKYQFLWQSFILTLVIVRINCKTPTQ